MQKCTNLGWQALTLATARKCIRFMAALQATYFNFVVGQRTHPVALPNFATRLSGYTIAVVNCWLCVCACLYVPPYACYSTSTSSAKVHIIMPRQCSAVQFNSHAMAHKCGASELCDCEVLLRELRYTPRAWPHSIRCLALL